MDTLLQNGTNGLTLNLSDAKPKRNHHEIANAVIEFEDAIKKMTQRKAAERQESGCILHLLHLIKDIFTDGLDVTTSFYAT